MRYNYHSLWNCLLSTLRCHSEIYSFGVRSVIRRTKHVFALSDGRWRFWNEKIPFLTLYLTAELWLESDIWILHNWFMAHVSDRIGVFDKYLKTLVIIEKPKYLFTLWLIPLSPNETQSAETNRYCLCELSHSLILYFRSHSPPPSTHWK